MVSQDRVPSEVVHACPISDEHERHGMLVI